MPFNVVKLYLCVYRRRRNEQSDGSMLNPWYRCHNITFEVHDAELNRDKLREAGKNNGGGGISSSSSAGKSPSSNRIFFSHTTVLSESFRSGAGEHTAASKSPSSALARSHKASFKKPRKLHRLHLAAPASAIPQGDSTLSFGSSLTCSPSSREPATRLRRQKLKPTVVDLSAHDDSKSRLRCKTCCTILRSLGTTKRSEFEVVFTYLKRSYRKIF